LAGFVGSKLSPQLEAKVIVEMEAFRQARAAQGFQLCLGYKAQSLGLLTLGTVGPRKSCQVTSQTQFDLASLTKIIATFSLFMMARQERLLDSWDQKLGFFFPSLRSDLKERSLLELMEHRAGLPSVFEETKTNLSDRDERIRFFLDQIESMMDPQRGELYSDVGYILLGLTLEKIYGLHLRDLFRNKLGQRFNLTYAPVDARWTWLHRFFEAEFPAPTLSLEEPDSWIEGEPQDPRAQWLGGAAGHAGLFGSAQAVEDWAREVYLSYHGKGVLFSDKLLREVFDFDRQTRFLGSWDRPTSREDKPSQAGRLASRGTVGHLGFAGGSLWMDLETGCRVTLLCHRHFPDGDDEALSRLRPAFHDWITENVFAEVKRWQ